MKYFMVRMLCIKDEKRDGNIECEEEKKLEKLWKKTLYSKVNIYFLTLSFFHFNFISFWLI